MCNLEQILEQLEHTSCRRQFKERNYEIDKESLEQQTPKVIPFKTKHEIDLAVSGPQQGEQYHLTWQSAGRFQLDLSSTGKQKAGVCGCSCP